MTLLEPFVKMKSNNLFFLKLVVVIVVASELIGQGFGCNEEAIKELVKDCSNRGRFGVKNFLRFYERLDLLYSGCLKQASTSVSNSLLLLAESACESTLMLLDQVKGLATLLQSFQNTRVSDICSIESAIKLYDYHNGFKERNPRIEDLFRRLANNVVKICCKLLDKRVASVDKLLIEHHTKTKVGELVKQILGDAERREPLYKIFGEMKPFAAQFVPILERELYRTESEPSSSSSDRRDFYNFPIHGASKHIEFLKESCQKLKHYHLNTLGLIGLMASLGYGDSKSFEAVSIKTKDWILSALTCQLSRNMLIEEVNDSKFYLVLRRTYEADVWREDEASKSDWELEIESKEIILKDNLHSGTSLFSIGGISFEHATFLSLHKRLMVNGPITFEPIKIMEFITLSS